MLVSITLLSGCLGGMNPTGTTTDSPTTEQIHATGEMVEIIDQSDRVNNVLVNDTYTYRTGKYDSENGTAVAYIETGGDLYRVRMNTTTDTVTVVEGTESVQLTTSR